ncbi:MAG: hypothetical protein N2385_14635, partial [Chloroflexus sp.]|nr:hypothetical protein [Chloroflexus sp.]
MFIWAGEFLANFLSWRTLWIGGRLGGGKTLLAVALADWLIKTHAARGLIANFPSALPPHPWREPAARHPRRGGIRGAAIIFDEAWQLLDRRSYMSNDRSYGAFARKLETFWLLPSVIPIDVRLSLLSCRREWQIATPLGNLWLYRWRLEAQPPAEGRFGLWRPERYYGSYDTKYIPVDDGDIKL